MEGVKKGGEREGEGEGEEREGERQRRRERERERGREGERERRGSRINALTFAVWMQLQCTGGDPGENLGTLSLFTEVHVLQPERKVPLEPA